MFKPGMCFWNWHVEYAHDVDLPLGDDAAPTRGGKTCTKERMNIVLQVYPSHLMVTTTGTHQGRPIEEVCSIPAEERGHYVDLVDSTLTQDHDHKPGTHKPLLIETTGQLSLRSGVVVNAAVVHQCVLSAKYRYVGMLEPASLARLRKISSFLRDTAPNSPNIPEEEIDYSIMRLPIKKTQSNSPEGGGRNSSAGNFIKTEGSGRQEHSGVMAVATPSRLESAQGSLKQDRRTSNRGESGNEYRTKSKTKSKAMISGTPSSRSLEHIPRTPSSGTHKDKPGPEDYISLDY